MINLKKLNQLNCKKNYFIDPGINHKIYSIQILPGFDNTYEIQWG